MPTKPNMRLTETRMSLNRWLRSRAVSIYVEWVGDVDEDAIAALLRREDAWDVAVDGDVDLEHTDCGGIAHAHTVFRFRIARSRPAYELLAVVAAHPLVFSTSLLTRG